MSAAVPVVVTVLTLFGLAWARSRSPDVREGDEVFVPITSLPAGTVPVVETGTVVVRVDELRGGLIRGPIQAYVLQEIPTLIKVPYTAAMIVVSVPEDAVTSVYRGGRKV